MRSAILRRRDPRGKRINNSIESDPVEEVVSDKTNDTAITGRRFGPGDLPEMLCLAHCFPARGSGKVLYNPEVQSQLFISLTPQRNVALSVAGLVVLSGLHGVLFAILRPSIPGESWIGKGVWWGLALWVVYWLGQEWFIYITLLGEPMGLAAFELGILLAGSLVEGVVIAGLLMRINGVRLIDSSTERLFNRV